MIEPCARLRLTAWCQGWKYFRLSLQTNTGLLLSVALDAEISCLAVCLCVFRHNVDVWFIIPAVIPICSGCAVSAAEHWECLSESWILQIFLLYWQENVCLFSHCFTIRSSTVPNQMWYLLYICGVVFFRAVLIFYFLFLNGGIAWLEAPLHCILEFL